MLNLSCFKEPMKRTKSEKVFRSFRTITDDNARGNDIVANIEKTKKKRHIEISKLKRACKNIEFL